MKQFCVLTAIMAAIFLIGCGGASETETDGSREVAGTVETTNATEASRTESTDSPPRTKPVTVWVALDGWETAETLGLVMAERRRYFTKARLSVTTLAPVTPALSIPDVLNGSDLIGVAHGPQVILAKEKGAPITILSSLVPHADAALIWPRSSGIRGIADLKGKTVAIPGLSFQRAFLASVLARGGLTLDDVKVKKVGNDLVPSLVKGKADAIFGGSVNVEGADLRARGLAPVITPIRSLGIPDYDELVLVARTDRVEEEPDVMRDFAMAAAQGATAAAGRPKEALKALRFAGERNPEIGLEARTDEVGQTIPLLSGTGHVDAKRLEGLMDWMAEQKMIQSRLPVETLLAFP
jgi:putative hydroxymethylpyrimidine transport system substrate-binding protein